MALVVYAADYAKNMQHTSFIAKSIVASSREPLHVGRSIFGL